jgi:hypothetical protein
MTLPELDPAVITAEARAITARVDAGAVAHRSLHELSDQLGHAWAVFWRALPLGVRCTLVLGGALLVSGAVLELVLRRRRTRRAPTPAPRQALGSALLGYAAVALGLSAAVWVLAAPPGGGPSGLHPGSTWDSSPHGALAALLLAGRCGLSAGRLERPWPPPRGVGVLVLLQPEEPPTPAERAALATWVEDGGALLIGLGTGPLGATYELDSAFGLELSDVEVYGRVAARGAAGEELLLPGGRVLRGAGWQPLAQGDRGVLCAGRPLGRGVAMACAGGFLFTNEGLGAAGNAVFAVRLLVAAAAGRKGDVVFDEFHHGWDGRAEAARLLGSSPPGWALVVAALAALAYGLARGRRVAPPMSPGPLASVELLPSSAGVAVAGGGPAMHGAPGRVIGAPLATARFAALAALVAGMLLLGGLFRPLCTLAAGLAVALAVALAADGLLGLWPAAAPRWRCVEGGLELTAARFGRRLRLGEPATRLSAELRLAPGAPVELRWHTRSRSPGPVTALASGPLGLVAFPLELDPGAEEPT